MDENLKQLLSAFNANHVKYVIIGGYANSIPVMIDGEVPARYISADDLITNKLASGRLQDLADVAAIRQARKALGR
jgi:hypothetical protein